MIGTVVSHYRVTDKIGAGGMGVVYRAEDQRLRRQVALKFLPDSAAADPLSVERFEREARTASALNHPNICIIHDVGEADGRRFIVMEMIEGVTLDRLIALGPIAVDRLMDIAIQVSDALDAAHSEGILHRDIKPGNIFLTKRDQVKVVDFGLAKMMPHRAGTPTTITEAGHFHTSVGIAVGTVAYMSPEHARGETLDARSDVFSLGVVLYEMATGVQTFRGQTTAVVFDQILNRVPTAPSVVNPQVPPQLEQIVARALEKDRRLRYQTARDLQADLERLRRDISRARAVPVPIEQARSIGEAWARVTPTPTDTALLSGPTLHAPARHTPDGPGNDEAGYRSPDSEELDRRRLSAPRVPPADQHLGPGSEALTQVDEATVIMPPLPPVGHESAPTIAVKSPVAGSDATLVAAPAPQTTAPRPVPAVAPAKASAPAAARPTPAPRRVAGQSAVPWVAGGGIAALLVLGGLAWWMFQPKEVALRAGDAPPPAAAPSASAPPPAAPTLPAPDTAASPGAVAPPAAEPSTVSPAPASPAVAARRPNAANAKPAAPETAVTVPPAEDRRVTATPPVSAANRAAEAATALANARELQKRAGDTAALAAFSGVIASFSGTPSAAEALALSADIHQRRSDFKAATEGWVAYGGLTGDGERAGEGLIRTADAAARRRSRGDDELARNALDELLTRFPSGTRALRALHMKMAVEDRLKLKQADSEFNDTVPASLITLRSIANANGNWPVSEYALWRLGEEYKDRDLHALAAQSFVNLATRFPNTKQDAWFAAGEIFERELKDPVRARDAYRRVPPSSKRYQDAQRRAQR